MRYENGHGEPIIDPCGGDLRLSQPGRAQAVPRAHGGAVGHHRAQQRPHPERVRRAHQQVRRGEGVGDECVQGEALEVTGPSSPVDLPCNHRAAVFGGGRPRREPLEVPCCCIVP